MLLLHAVFGIRQRFLAAGIGTDDVPLHRVACDAISCESDASAFVARDRVFRPGLGATNRILTRCAIEQHAVTGVGHGDRPGLIGSNLVALDVVETWPLVWCLARFPWHETQTDRQPGPIPRDDIAFARIGAPDRVSGGAAQDDYSLFVA